jgi:hypothetical protein
VKGIIFNMVEEAICADAGEQEWDALLTAAHLEGGYSSLGSYPDAELLTLIGLRAENRGETPTEATRSLGHAALLGLAGRYPHFFSPHTRTRDFLLTLNDVIHPEVRKVHAEADPPVFEFDTSDPERLVIGYRSQRRLCALAEGMIAGAATHYGERATLTHARCMHDGSDECEIHATFDRGADAAAHG